METIYFEETQYFPWGFLLIPALVAILFGVFFFVQVIFKIKVGNRPLPNWLLFLIFLVTVGFTVFMGSQKLTLKITNKAVYFSLGAFASMQSIKTAEMASINLRKYNGMDEFSGWGNKSNAMENSYTTSGDYGIEIKFKKSAQKSILIGTHKPKQVHEILSKYFQAFMN
ncbi:MAG: hypothetical protein JWR02_2155 [Mucilaginibacter sp.]|nr:hypothetical protein [Mucilaginibacter sp.]